jgi:cyclopropane fatty-acyl-phospholipid synthase-like methyltransferase
MDRNFKHDIEALSKHYGGLVRRHGDAPESAQYADRETQERRMAVLCEIGVAKDSKVLDFGCGTGQLLSFLKRSSLRVRPTRAAASRFATFSNSRRKRRSTTSSSAVSSII